MLWDARIQRQGTRRYMAEKFSLTHEMSYEMFRGHCHSRCRISWRRSRAADLHILRSKDSLEQKVVLTFRRVLANICRPVMETVPVLSFGKFRENGKKNWTKNGENLWTILVLPSSFPLEYLFDLRFLGLLCTAFMCPIFWTPVCLWDQRSFLEPDVRTTLL